MPGREVELKRRGSLKPNPGLWMSRAAVEPIVT